MLFFAAISTMLLLSTSGLFINIYIFKKLFENVKDSSEFTKLCMAKTVPNTLVCAGFLFWSVPLSVFQISLDHAPLSLNVLIGQVVGYGAYVSGPCIQCLLAFNRWFTLWFPMKKLSLHGNSVTIIALSLVLLLATFYTIRGLFPIQCGFFYDPLQFLWIGDSTECSKQGEKMIATTVICFTLISNSLNFSTLIKLCWEKVGGLSNEALTKRRRKRIRLFVQCVTQDCLHLIDVINWNFISYLSDEIYFQFIFVTLSLLLIHSLDGFVIFYFHTEIHPKLLRGSKSTPITLTG